MATYEEKRALRYSAVCVLLFALGNFALGPIASYVLPRALLELLVLASPGLIAAQGALHAIWCVFAPLSLKQRLVTGALAGFTLFATWILGVALFVADTTWLAFAMAGLLFLPLVAVATQAPLWVAKRWLRWRILFPWHDPRESPDRPPGIRELLVATGVVALALSGARLAASFSTVPLEFLASFAVFALAAAILSALTTIPVLLATLHAGRLRLALPTLVLVDLAITLGGIATFAALAPEGASMGWEGCIRLASMAGAYFACLTGVLLVVRGLGLRLFWGRSQREP